MIKIVFKSGDILKSEADMLVNPVNTKGVMGAGLAAKFKKAYPDNFLQYEKYCESKNYQLDKFRVFVTEEAGKLICNLPTKEDYRNLSDISYVRNGIIWLLFYLNNYPERDKLKTIAIPPLGCGLGGLSQLTVLHLILYHLKFTEYTITVELYDFTDVPKYVRDFMVKHYDLTDKQLRRFTAVGSRKLSKIGRSKILNVLDPLSVRELLLCTGDAAEGCDYEFWQNWTERKIRFGPVNRGRYSKDTQVVPEDNPIYKVATTITSKTHPAWRFLPDAHKPLHIRNVFQVLGARCSRPSEFLLCWTPDGAETKTTKKTGGTGTAIRIANMFGIPVFNLYNEDSIERLYKFLNIKYPVPFKEVG